MDPVGRAGCNPVVFVDSKKVMEKDVKILKDLSRVARETIALGQQTILTIDEQDKKLAKAEVELEHVEDKVKQHDRVLKNIEYNEECRCLLF